MRNPNPSCNCRCQPQMCMSTRAPHAPTSSVSQQTLKRTGAAATWAASGSSCTCGLLSWRQGTRAQSEWSGTQHQSTGRTTSTTSSSAACYGNSVLLYLNTSCACCPLNRSLAGKCLRSCVTTLVCLFHKLCLLSAQSIPCRKVFEKLCDDFGSKRRERVVRLDVPLQAFDSPASSSASASPRHGGTSSRLNASGNFVGPGGTALAAGLDELCAGLRDSIRAAFEARKMAYDAEVGCGVVVVGFSVGVCR